jgi:GNAT superfamily N-acetyltransferase
MSRALFDEYIEERRAAPIPGFTVEVLPDFTRYLPASGEGEGMVMYARLEEGEAARHIEEQSRLFASRGLVLEWKVYDLDRPANLKALLEAAGFAAHHREVFMLRDIDGEPAGRHAVPGDVEIRAASAGNPVIDDIVKVQEETWDCAFPGLAAQLRNALATNSPESAIYCAYLDGTPVGTGWIDFTAGSRFADIHGGAVLPHARGRGIYTLLYQRRVDDARARGVRFLAVDAAPMSRPILLGKGFMHVCDTYPMRSSPHRKRGK